LPSPLSCRSSGQHLSCNWIHDTKTCTRIFICCLLQHEALPYLTSLSLIASSGTSPPLLLIRIQFSTSRCTECLTPISSQLIMPSLRLTRPPQLPLFLDQARSITSPLGIIIEEEEEEERVNPKDLRGRSSLLCLLRSPQGDLTRQLICLLQRSTPLLSHAFHHHLLSPSISTLNPSHPHQPLSLHLSPPSRPLPSLFGTVMRSLTLVASTLSSHNSCS
jgi:hypothetical protein